MKSTLQAIIVTGLAGALLAGGGCVGGGDLSRAPTGMLSATALARSVDPADAALDAARAARGRLGEQVPVRVVLFFECFNDVDATEQVAASIASVFPDATLVGCSVDGVATAEASTDDRGIAVVALGGDVGRVTSAYLPETTESAEQAGRLLNEQLGTPPDSSLLLLLVDERTARQFKWDPNDLLDGILANRRGRTLVVGGLAAARGDYDIARIYHNQAGYTDGLVALQISGPIGWTFDSGAELLQVGGVYRTRSVQDYILKEVAQSGGGGVQTAGDLVRQFLIAQELSDGHIGRLLGDRYVPLHFAMAAGGGLRLPTKLDENERIVVLQSGTAVGRSRVLGAALENAATGLWRGVDGVPVTLAVLPSGPNAAFGAELAEVRSRLRGQGLAHPVPVAILSPGQFAALRGEGGRIVHQYVDHTTVVTQFARQVPGAGDEPRIYVSDDTQQTPEPKIYGPDGRPIQP